jgi:hypothetical protein
MLLGILIGMFLGATLGTFAMAAVTVAGQSDDVHAPSAPEMR